MLKRPDDFDFDTNFVGVVVPNVVEKSLRTMLLSKEKSSSETSQ